MGESRTAPLDPSANEASALEVAKPHLGLASVVFTTLMLLVNISPSLGGAGATNLGRQAAFLLLFGGLVLAARPLRTLQPLLRVPSTVVAPLAWCWLSLAWSISPSDTLRRVLLTTLLIWSMFLASDLLGYRRAMALGRVAAGLSLVANLAAVLALPSIGIHGADAVDAGLAGDWRGLTPNKNSAGALCAISIIILLFGPPTQRHLARYLIAAGCAVFLVKSDSATSMGMLALALCAGWLFRRYDPRYRSLFVPGGMLLSVAVVLLMLSSGPYLDAIDSSRTAFTGRVQIWKPVLNFAADHLWTGSGYGAFWNIGPDSPIYRYSRGWVAELITSGHNGYLDLTAQIGLPGMLLVVTAVLLWPLAQLVGSTRIGREEGAPLLAIIVFVAGHNVTESGLFERDVITQVYLMFALALLSLQLRTPSQSGS